LVGGRKRIALAHNRHFNREYRYAVAPLPLAESCVRAAPSVTGDPDIISANGVANRARQPRGGVVREYYSDYTVRAEIRLGTIGMMFGVLPTDICGAKTRIHPED